MRTAFTTTLCLGLLAATTAGCNGEPDGPAPIDFSAKATLDGSRLTIDITIDRAQDKAGFEALGEHTSYWGGDEKPVPISVPVEKLKVGAKTISVKGGATVKEVAIEAKTGWTPTTEAAEAAKQAAKRSKGKKGAVWSPPLGVTFSSATLGPDIIVPGSMFNRGVMLTNLRGGTVQGQPVTVAKNLAWLRPSYLVALRDQGVKDLLPHGPLKRREEPVKLEVSAELEDWFGETSTHTITLSLDRQAARSNLRDQLRSLAKDGGAVAGWTGGRGVFVASDVASDGLVVGTAKTFADLGYVAWIALKPGAGRKVGKCSYVGGSFDHIVKDAEVTLRSLKDGAVVVQDTLKGRSSGCPATVHAAAGDTVIVSRPTPYDAKAWVLKRLPSGS